jgi:hypothetical protein
VFSNFLCLQLDDNLGDYIHVIEPLEQALMSRQRLLEAAVEDIYEKFYSDIALVLSFQVQSWHLKLIEG